MEAKMTEPEKVEFLLKSHLQRNNLLFSGESSWTVGYSRLGGRGLFATKDIRPGEAIFVDAALVIGPRSYRKYLPMCVNCYKNGCPLFPCDRGCGLPVCSEKCENSTRHIEQECNYLRARMPKCGSNWSMDLLCVVVAVRALFLNREERDLLAALQCHKGLYHGHEVKMLERNVSRPPSEEETRFMEEVCEVFDTNSFETMAIPSEGYTASLRGLYPMGSLQNHCCVPNTRHHFDSKQRLHVTAALPISKGEELTMTYTDLFWDTTLRRSYLHATKHFSCKCRRCCDRTEFGSNLGALLCATDCCSGILLPADPLDLESVWICDLCSTIVGNRQIRSIRSGLAAIVEETLYKKPRQILRFLKKELGIIVPKDNYIDVDMKYRVVSYFGRTENLSWSDLTDDELVTKSLYCQDLLRVLDVLGCGDCKKKGLILHELYRTNVELFERNQKIYTEKNEVLLKEALEILQDDIATPRDN